MRVTHGQTKKTLSNLRTWKYGPHSVLRLQKVPAHLKYWEDNTSLLVKLWKKLWASNYFLPKLSTLSIRHWFSLPLSHTCTSNKSWWSREGNVIILIKINVIASVQGYFKMIRASTLILFKFGKCVLCTPLCVLTLVTMIDKARIGVLQYF